MNEWCCMQGTYSCKNAFQPAASCPCTVLAVHAMSESCRRAPTTPCWVHGQYSQNGNQQSIYCQSEDVNMQCNFKTAAFAQMGDAKWAISPVKEYPPKAKQVAAAITNKESTKRTAIMVLSCLVRVSFSHEVAAVQLAAGWARCALVTPKIRESSNHPRSFAGGQYRRASPTPPFLYTAMCNKQAKHIAVIITPTFGW